MLMKCSAAFEEHNESSSANTSHSCRTQVNVFVSPAKDSSIDQAQEPAEARLRRRQNIDRRIASHPSAWARGSMVPSKPVVRQQREHDDEPSATTPRPPSPPTWYYRHVIAQRLPKKPELPQRMSKEKQRKGDNRSFALSPSAAQQSSYAPAQKRNVASIMQSKRHVSPPREPYEKEAYTSRRRQRISSSEEEHRPKVRFAAGTYGTKAARMQDEAVRDWRQARKDQHELDHRKKEVRHLVEEGGGTPYEPLD